MASNLNPSFMKVFGDLSFEKNCFVSFLKKAILFFNIKRGCFIENNKFSSLFGFSMAVDNLFKLNVW